MVQFVAGIILLLIISIIILAVFNKRIGNKIAFYPVAVIGIIGIAIVPMFWNSHIHSVAFPWFEVGHLLFSLELVLDSVSVMMISLVSFIGFLVYWFSMDYLKEEEGKKRYFILLLFFMLSMYGLVISGNLFQLFFFWELVSFCSYGLIGFHYKKVYTGKAATKAFLVNRLADIFIVAGLGLLYQQHGTLSLLALHGHGNISFIGGLFLLIGASGKSAQYPFALWLPDAMAGPTPVSAFIHAATMVTAGIILLVRIYFLLPEEVITIMAFLGAVTAVAGGLAALVQHDIKKVLAYSTISQLGYMVTGLGTGAWDASLFHLFTHAFFKAGLFLNAGAIIMFLRKVQSDQGVEFNGQDMRFMGGLKKYMPLIFISFTLCSLALIGGPMFSGYLSKDAIIAGAYAWADSKVSPIFYIVPDLAFLTIILTAIYMIRMWCLIFLGESKVLKQFPDMVIKVKLNYTSVKVSTFLLGILSLGFVVSFNPLDLSANWVMPGIRNYLAFNPNIQVPFLASGNHMLISIVSVTLIIIGSVFAWYRYRPNGSYHEAYITYDFQKKYLKTVYNHYYLDSIYKRGALIFLKAGGVGLFIEKHIFNNIIHKFAIVNVVLGHIFKMIDKYIIDGIVNFSALFAGYLGKKAKGLASGKVQGQLVTALFFFIIILLIILI